MTLSHTMIRQGMETAETLTLLLKENPTISAIYAMAYTHPKLLQERLGLTDFEKTIVMRATVLRGSTGLPFWEALLVSCFAAQGDVSRLVSEAMYHQSRSEMGGRICRGDVLAGHLESMIASLPDGQHLSFLSRVEIENGTTLQLPLLDFHCRECDSNDALVSQVCKSLFRCAALVYSSGESYHAIGLGLLSNSDFRALLARSLLFSPIVDARYVAHQLLDGVCALRLSGSLNKPKRPCLKFVVQNC